MTDVFKRPALPLVPREGKRTRFDDEPRSLVQANQEENVRTSHLFSPIVSLTGHDGEIYAAEFSKDGNCLASTGYDMKIFLWNVFGECENFSTLSGHTGAVMDLHFNSDSSHIYTCSTDKTVRVWDMESGNCIRKLKTHTDFVNSCYPARRGPELIVSGSDDGTIIVHDTRKKTPAFQVENTNKYQVTAVTFDDTAQQIVSGGIDNVIKIWDIRRNEAVHFLVGHADTITGLSLSPEGSHVLSNSMDCTARIFTGHQHNFEKNLLRCAWSADSSKVSCGSSDRFVYVWEVPSRNIAYRLPGHQGSVNAVGFHPNEPILLSAGSDKRIFLSEYSH
uniref:U5 small nuclear ribonucleoprotein 40 kDa protein n=1 Tax=Ditylenchus dipsaci TaxID=166011 RepID=A0A915CRC5_9BILA